MDGSKWGVCGQSAPRANSSRGVQAVHCTDKIRTQSAQHDDTRSEETVIQSGIWWSTLGVQSATRDEYVADQHSCPRSPCMHSWEGPNLPRRLQTVGGERSVSAGREKLQSHKRADCSGRLLRAEGRLPPGGPEGGSLLMPPSCPLPDLDPADSKRQGLSRMRFAFNIHAAPPFLALSRDHSSLRAHPQPPLAQAHSHAPHRAVFRSFLPSFAASRALHAPPRPPPSHCAAAPSSTTPSCQNQMSPWVTQRLSRLPPYRRPAGRRCRRRQMTRMTRMTRHRLICW